MAYDLTWEDGLGRVHANAYRLSRDCTKESEKNLPGALNEGSDEVPKCFVDVDEWKNLAGKYFLCAYYQ